MQAKSEAETNKGLWQTEAPEQKQMWVTSVPTFLQPFIKTRSVGSPLCARHALRVRNI